MSDILRHSDAREILLRYMPDLTTLTQQLWLAYQPLRLVAATAPGLENNQERLDSLYAELAQVEWQPADETAREVELARDSDYEGVEVVEASAEYEFTESVTQFGRFQMSLRGPSHGNPFVDVFLEATVSGPRGPVVVSGFYDGDGRYVIRYLPEVRGKYVLETASNARSLSGIVVEFEVVDALPGAHGPVRVHEQYHFAYEDGERYSPIGTTAYAWTHQPDSLQDCTLKTLSQGPFNKIRMCVFPKSYIYNENEPDRFPFPRDAQGQFEWDRFDVEFWRRFESQIEALGELGIEADLILFHPYDRWGFAEMSSSVDEFYLRYVVARLGSYANVWWSLANEYDLLKTKTIEDWERFASLVVSLDPVGHLISIHNCFEFYDYGRPWITHSSVQRVDLYKTAELTGDWRQRWGKPVVIDECGYEGDIDQGWGNLSAQEMVRRFWEGAVRGGYVGHGETYVREDDVLWWSKGGDLHGDSPERIAFLRRILEDAPGHLEPDNREWDAPSASVGEDYILFYFGFSQPSFRRFIWDPSDQYWVDVIDTWNMTITRLPQTVAGRFVVTLPGRPFMALRFQKVTNPVEGVLAS